MTDKAELRKQFIAKRQQLNASELANKSRQIAKHIETIYQNKHFEAVHVFLSMVTRHEIDTSFIIDYLKSQGTKIIVSKTNFKDNTLSHYHLKDDTELIENKWGIPEPINASNFPVDQIDLVLVPLLCFDIHGNRVGYGKGFYDRFLAGCQPETMKIGLSLFSPIEKIAINEFDVPLDKCITPQEVFSF